MFKLTYPIKSLLPTPKRKCVTLYTRDVEKLSSVTHHLCIIYKTFFFFLPFLINKSVISNASFSYVHTPHTHIRYTLWYILLYTVYIHQRLTITIRKKIEFDVKNDTFGANHRTGIQHYLIIMTPIILWYVINHYDFLKRIFYDVYSWGYIA